MPIYLVALNVLIFTGLGWYVLRVSRTAPTETIYTMWRLAVLPVVAVVLGGLQRVAIQAVRVGWLPDEALELLLEGWQVAQSAIVALIGIYTLIGMKRLADRIFRIQVVIGDMADRVGSMSLEELKLTHREREVLTVIGSSTQIDDRSLSEKLGISPDTAHTHVSSLLKKTKLRDRRDLMVLAYSLRVQGTDSSNSARGTDL